MSWCELWEVFMALRHISGQIGYCRGFCTAYSWTEIRLKQQVNIIFLARPFFCISWVRVGDRARFGGGCDGRVEKNFQKKFDIGVNKSRGTAYI